MHNGFPPSQMYENSEEKLEVPYQNRKFEKLKKFHISAKEYPYQRLRGRKFRGRSRKIQKGTSNKSKF